MAASKRYSTSGFSDDELAILTVAENFLRGIIEKDKALMLAQILPTGGATLMRNGAPVFTTLAGIVERIPFDYPGTMDEFISDQPTVMIDRDIAMLWTPYEFWIDGKLDHVGTDIWSFARLDGKWIVSGVADNSHKPAA